MLFEEERKQRIVLFVEKNSRASVQELSQELGVSESTVRRDLKELEEAKLLKRTHGVQYPCRALTLRRLIQIRKIDCWMRSRG